MTRDAEQLALLSRLLDEGLDLAPEDRPAWIDALSGDAEPLQPQLRRLLAHSLQPAPDASDPISRQVHAALVASVAPWEFEQFCAGKRIGPYELVHEIGRGGMATVWLARRVEGLVGRRVALKLPHAGWGGAHLAERIAREREILKNLEHPHIARLNDAGVTAGGQPWLALEYVEGLPITEHCDRFHLGFRDRLGLFLQVLKAVQFAHSNLIIHRDLKPANIIVTAQGTAVVLDFGIAKLLSEGLSVETALTQLGGRAVVDRMPNRPFRAGSCRRTRTHPSEHEIPVNPPLKTPSNSIGFVCRQRPRRPLHKSLRTNVRTNGPLRID